MPEFLTSSTIGNFPCSSCSASEVRTAEHGCHILGADATHNNSLTLEQNKQTLVYKCSKFFDKWMVIQFTDCTKSLREQMFKGQNSESSVTWSRKQSFSGSCVIEAVAVDACWHEFSQYEWLSWIIDFKFGVHNAYIKHYPLVQN